eukprot:gene59436-81364_t
MEVQAFHEGSATAERGQVRISAKPGRNRAFPLPALAQPAEGPAMEQESPADKVRLDETLLVEQMRSLSSQAPTMFLFIIANTLVMQVVTAHERWQMHSYVVSLLVTAVCTARIIRWRQI